MITGIDEAQGIKVINCVVFVFFSWGYTDSQLTFLKYSTTVKSFHACSMSLDSVRLKIKRKLQRE